MTPSPTKIIAAQHLLPIEGQKLSPGALAIQGGAIVELGNPEELQKKFPGASLESFPQGTLLPGLVNAHSDLSLSLFPPPELNPLPRPEGGLPLLMPWLIATSRYKAQLALKDQQAAIQKGLDATLRSGVTTIGDQCRFPIAISQYEKSGLRVVCLAEMDNIKRDEAQAEFEQVLALVDEVLHGKNPKITAGLAPFSAYTLSKNLLRILSHHAIQLNIPLHLHAALTFSEMEFFYDSMGEIPEFLFKEAGWEEKIPPPHKMTPIQYLHEIGFLKARPSLVGCLHLGPTDVGLLQNYGCQRIYAPRAFEQLQLGEIPWLKLYKEKFSWALGTMSAAAGSSLNLWDEMRAVWYAAEVEDRESFAQWILSGATLGAARTLHLEKQVGSLIKNKQADCIVLTSPTEEDSLYAGLIDQTTSEQLLAAFVAGEPVYRK